MNKREAIKYITEIRGFVPGIAIFELFTEEEEIPEELIEIMTEVSSQEEIVLFCGADLYHKIQDMFAFNLFDITEN